MVASPLAFRERRDLDVGPSMMPATTSALADQPAYDPLRLDVDPYPTYCWLRAEAPLYKGYTSSVGRFWALSRFDDVQAAARDWETFSSAHGNDLDDTGDLFGPAPAMDLCDPPIHARQRQVLRSEFGLRAVREKLESNARRKIRALIDRLAECDEVDLADDLGYTLPASVIFEWLGFPATDHAEIRRWHRGMLERVLGVMELPADAVALRDQLWAYLEQELATRRAVPGDDLMTVLANAVADGRLSKEEALANALFLLDAGIVSSSALIANTFLHLHRDTRQMTMLREQPQAIPAAIEELLRFDAPFQWFTRVTTRDVVIHETLVPAGERIVLIWASANRDERRWENADRLVLDRAPQRHLSFSEGIHHCLGAPIARMEMRLLLEELLPRLVDYELAGKVERRITPSERTIVRLPARVVWTRS